MSHTPDWWLARSVGDGVISGYGVRNFGAGLPQGERTAETRMNKGAAGLAGHADVFGNTLPLCTYIHMFIKLKKQVLQVLHVLRTSMDIGDFDFAPPAQLLQSPAKRVQLSSLKKIS
jgi:hypothetical protein